MTRRSIQLIVFGLCSGALLGTLVGDFMAFLLPDGSAVKQFFLLSYDFTFGSMNSDYLIDLGVIVIDFGFILKFNAVSYTHLTLPTICSV